MKYRVAFYTTLIALMVLSRHSYAEDIYEPWAVETAPNGMVNIEINVKGCITKFTVPEKKMQESNVNDSILDMAEKRQENGCK